MKIPKKIQLLGHEIKTFPGTKKMSKQRTTGLADFRKLRIYIGTELNGRKIPKTEQEQTYFHELVHHCLRQMNNEKLNADEPFVDMLGSLLHQALAPHMK